jgi:hypothetical protein
MRQLMASLESLLSSVNSGDLRASISTQRRLEGAIVALGAALGELDRVEERLLGGAD